ncbi:VTT domain-containing protein [Nocardia sp. NPDC088792]|uniref:VTT domain-containing protein n=1 Tax=Nocardia sp. NPDC088792 TaxID=3364332 RepID=UPI0037FB90D2
MGLAALITAFVAAVLPVTPTEPTLVGLGALAAFTHVSPLTVMLVGGVGCSVSDHLLYAGGRWGGHRILGWLSRGRSTRKVTGWLLDRTGRWGAPIFIGARWLPAGGSAGAVLAGTLRWKLRRFTPVSLVGSMLWACYATMLGYLGSSITGNPLAGLGISLLVAVVLALAARPLLHRHSGTTTVPSNTAAVPDNIATVPYDAITEPDNTAASPGNAATVPDNTAASPGNAATVPDNTVTSPGNTATVPDNTVTSPGNTATVPNSQQAQANLIAV